jgi:O-glycosyl hydrolase
VNDRDSTAELNLFPEGFDSAGLTPYITNDSLNMERGHDIVSESRKYKILLSPRSVVTFVGEKNI